MLGLVGPDVIRFRVGPNEQTGPVGFHLVADLPGVIRTRIRIVAPDGHNAFTQVGCTGNRTAIRVIPVGARTGVRQWRCVDQGFQLVGFGINDDHFVRRVRSDLEVAARGVKEPVMQELGAVDLVDPQVIQIGVIHLPELTEFLHSDNPSRLVRGGVDGGHAGLFHIVPVHVVATSRDDLFRLHRVGINDGEMRRPIGPTDDVLTVTRYGHVAGVIANGHFGHQHVLGVLPQVDLGHLAVAAHRVPEATRVLRLFQLMVFRGF